MWASENNPYDAWPRVRRVKPGVFRVQGRLVPIPTWLVVRRLSAVAAYLLCLWLLGAAMLPALEGLPRSLGPGHPVSAAVGTMIDFRLLLRELLTERFPEAGRAIYYSGQSPYDWHVLALFVLAFRGRKLVGYTVCVVLVAVLWPLLARGFKITFTRDWVVLHGWLRPRKLRRGGPAGDVTFRTAGAQYQTGLVGRLLRAGCLKPGGESDYSVVHALAAHRPIRVIAPRLLMDAERIVQSCHLAMNATRTL